MIEDRISLIRVPGGKLLLWRQNLEIHIHVLDRSLVDVLIRLRGLLVSHNQIGIIDFMIKIIIPLFQVRLLLWTSASYANTRSRV